MRTKERILLESKAWREEKLSLDPDYFMRLNEMHDPKILWISSADSLASVREITNTEPGDIIIYGNLGAQVREDDPSLMSLLEDAVENYRVSQIIVCGYSHCAGVRQVLKNNLQNAMTSEWLSKLKGLYDRHFEEIKDLPFEKQERLLSELNIREQVINLSHIACIQRAWEKRDYPEIHGWYFDLSKGMLQEVFSLEKNHRIKQLSSLNGNVSPIKITAS
jgi:carbonic anhydrase